MTTMRAAVWTGTGVVEPQLVPVPQPGPGEVLVRVSHTGICGTDFSILRGQHPRATPPLIMGHELSGHVESVGEGGALPGLEPGALVVAEPLISCGECWACTHGATHVCRRLGLYGIDAPGGLAEYLVLPAAVLHPIPSGVDPQRAALVEPLSVAVHAVSKSGVQPGDTVAVFGAGPIGVLTALVARHAGAERIVISEPNAWRAGVAAELGFEVVAEGEQAVARVRELSDGEGADVVFDSAGHPAVAPLLAEAGRVLATIVVVGVHKALAPVDLHRLNFAEQRMQGVRVYTHDDVARAIELVASGALPLDRLPVRVFGIDEVAAAFDAAMTGDRNLKVMIAP